MFGGWLWKRRGILTGKGGRFKSSSSSEKHHCGIEDEDDDEDENEASLQQVNACAYTGGSQAWPNRIRKISTSNITVTQKIGLVFIPR
jgi:hypothetical protein